MLCAASVELPMGSRSTFLPVACSKVSVTGMLWWRKGGLGGVSFFLAGWRGYG